MAGAVLSLAVLLGLAGAPAAAAQPPTRPPAPPADTTRRPAADTTRRPAADTTRRRDSTQVVLPAAGQRADSARASSIDSVQGVPDSLRTPRARADSIQAPLARAELPISVGVGPLYRWTRDSVYSTGAVNLADLLERVPGVTMFRSGFLASAQTAAYMGDLARVRVFRDGVELDVLDPRSGGVRDLADIQLTNVAELVIERAAGELRVLMRTWTVVSTTPYTRVDAFTGDEDTNLYRFFFGRRFGSGYDAQLGVQQVGTGSRNRRVGGGGSILDAMARVGWAKGRWSADAVYSRLDRDRDQTTNFTTPDDSLIPPYDARRNDGYVRVAWGDPESRGLWVQGIASHTSLSLANTSRLRFVDSTGRSAVGSVITDTVTVPDSSVSRTQYVASAGYTIRGITLSATDRLRVFGGSTYNTPSARASFESRLFAVSAFVERGAPGPYVVDSTRGSDSTRVPRTVVIDGVSTDIVKDTVYHPVAGIAELPWRTTRLDVSGRLSPLPWVALLGTVSQERRSFYPLSDTTPSQTNLLTTRLEAAVRLGRLWVSGGVVRRGADSLVAPRVYECLRVEGSCLHPLGDADLAATGVVFGARGPFYKDAYLDVTGTAWKQSVAAYRPQYQLRGEVGVQTNWLRRFPSGNFGFKAAAIDEYRARVRFPVDYVPTEGAPLCDLQLCVPPTNVLSAQLEIRIQTGIVSYQVRNALSRRYELVPGVRAPGPISYYGVRWTFFN